MLLFEGPENWSSWGFHGVEGFGVGLAEKNYSCYTGWVPTSGAERISDTVVFFPPQKYAYDLPALQTQEEVVQEAAKVMVDRLRTLATNNPTYTQLSKFSGLQQMSDIINSAAKKALDSKTQESQRVTPPNIPGGQRVGPNIIEDDSEDTSHQLIHKIKEKGKETTAQKTSMWKEIRHTTDHWVGQHIDIQHGILSNRCTSNR